MIHALFSLSVPLKATVGARTWQDEMSMESVARYVTLESHSQTLSLLNSEMEIVHNNVEKMRLSAVGSLKVCGRVGVS